MIFKLRDHRLKFEDCKRTKQEEEDEREREKNRRREKEGGTMKERGTSQFR